VLSAGLVTTLSVEKPAVGGRMIARVDGQVVLVAGAIPGERVSARIERVGKGVAYADTVALEQPSSDRREPFTDPLCGGCLYAHIAYPRQLLIKGQVITDAFGRIGRLVLPTAPIVAPSPDEGYRMRARLHLRAGSSRAGFFREGTHEVCDARATRQLLPATCDVLDRLSATLRSRGEAVGACEIDISENIDASERTMHLETDAATSSDWLPTLSSLGGVKGITSKTQSVGDPYVTDQFSIEGLAIILRRHVLAFFQGNRFLLRDLLAHVAAQIPQGSSVVDLYAGVGAFSVAAALTRGARVIAVEGDQPAASDLNHNAAAANGAVEAVHQSVELFTARPRSSPEVALIDPPRTGMSKQALAGVVRLRAKRLVYVSCDVATLARDTRSLLDAGYAIQRVDAFDLFPNTPHVETVVTFENLGI
jgi:23S rRNA (uracil1939-C5)-methyltransferase